MNLHIHSAWRRAVLRPGWLLVLLLMIGLGSLGGCASLGPPPADRPVQQALPARTDQGLGAIAQRALAQARPAGPSALLSLAHPIQALDARLTLIQQARHSIDLQTYHLADDSVGRSVLRALRDAARRGVRVRLLIDDFHTTGLDPLLLGLAAEPGVSLRLFNPFVDGRDSAVGRWLQMAGDFRRLNHRMHNKLFIADGAMALVGGRNIAEGYFHRSDEANFIDFEALATGALVADLAAIFDRYWNSPVVRDLQDVTLAARSADEAARWRAGFDLATGPAAAALEATLPAALAPALQAVPPRRAFADMLAEGLPGLIGARARAVADNPEKLSRQVGDSLAETATYEALAVFRTAREELLLFSPYFIPGEPGMAGLQEARSHGIAVRVVTNALGASDEPLAALAYERYRVPLLEMGVELYEVSSEQVQRDDRQRSLFGRSRAQLHTKLAMVDRRTLLIGSLNLDQRSATTNTELAVVVDSPELTREVLAWFNGTSRQDVRGSYQLKLRPGGGLQWVALLGEGRTEVFDEEPEPNVLRRLKLWFMSLLVPESLL